MSVDLKVHKYERRGQQTVLTEVKNYVMVKDPNSDMRYYLQAGKYYCGLDEHIKEEDVPEWLKERVKAMNPKVLEACGFGRAGIKATTETPEQRRKQLLKEGLISQEEYDRLSEIKDEEKNEAENEETDEEAQEEVVRTRRKTA